MKDLLNPEFIGFVIVLFVMIGVPVIYFLWRMETDRKYLHIKATKAEAIGNANDYFAEIKFAGKPNQKVRIVYQLAIAGLSSKEIILADTWEQAWCMFADRYIDKDDKIVETEWKRL